MVHATSKSDSRQGFQFLSGLRVHTIPQRDRRMATTMHSKTSFVRALAVGLLVSSANAVCNPDCPGDRPIARGDARNPANSNALWGGTPAPTPVDPDLLTLYLLDGTKTDPGAVCLDGSPGGFYFRPALTAEHKNDWLLHFKGAGWSVHIRLQLDASYICPSDFGPCVHNCAWLGAMVIPIHAPLCTWQRVHHAHTRNCLSV